MRILLLLFLATAVLVRAAGSTPVRATTEAHVHIFAAAMPVSSPAAIRTVFPSLATVAPAGWRSDLDVAAPWTRQATGLSAVKLDSTDYALCTEPHACGSAARAPPAARSASDPKSTSVTEREERTKMANIQAPEEQPRTAASQRLTPAQNTVLTIKLLVGAGLLIGLFWFIDRAVS